MAWSIEDTRPADPVLGDPASVAALAATLRRTAEDLQDALERLAAQPPGSRRHASRLRRLHTDLGAVAASLERTGGRLAEHAIDLADARGLAHRLRDRAQGLGLRVDGPVVSRPRGVHGVADEAAETERDAALSRLQQVLDAVLIDLEARRRALREDVDSERERRASR